MAISIDTVYQRVLAFANKEQRGYITPQEFNLFANQAQIEIFEQYFYDLNVMKRVHGNDTIHSDVSDILEEKMQLFEVTHGVTDISTYSGSGPGGLDKFVPDYFYRISMISVGEHECEIMNTRDFTRVRKSPLTRPTEKRPIANIREGVIRCFINETQNATPNIIVFYRKPHKATWGYVVIHEKALYNSSTSNDFELHPAEETELVYKILKFAGIAIKREDLMRAGQGLEMTQVQLEKQ